MSGYDTYVPSCCHMYHCVIGVCILQDNKCQFCNTERNSTYTKRTPGRSGTNCIILGLAIIIVTSMFNAQCKQYCKEVLSVLSCLVCSFLSAFVWWGLYNSKRVHPGARKQKTNIQGPKAVEAQPMSQRTENGRITYRQFATKQLQCPF